MIGQGDRIPPSVPLIYSANYWGTLNSRETLPRGVTPPKDRRCLQSGHVSAGFTRVTRATVHFYMVPPLSPVLASGYLICLARMFFKYALEVQSVR